MSNWSYTEEELQQYFSDPETRRRSPGNGYADPGAPRPPRRGVRGFFHRRFDDPRKAQAALVLSALVAFVLVITLGIGIYLLTLLDELPSFEALDHPEFQLATVAYTSDGKELARYAFQNRSWAEFDEISPHVVNALVATEDHRFYNHWGVDLQGIFAAASEIVTQGDLRGASTISQQLARNLFNEQIGFDVSLERKLKEMVTAVELERRYTKREIIEMYLNTVEFGQNAWGIEAAARTFFNKSAAELSVPESATLVGMLQAITRFNPIRNPNLSKGRRDQVMKNMVAFGFITPEAYAAYQAEPIITDYNSSEITASLAPYFAEYVRNWLRDWAKETGHSLYEDGLVVYTTLDSRLQEMARSAVNSQMKGLQAVVDYEWSRPYGYQLSTEIEPYLQADGYEPFAHFWTSQRDIVNNFIKETTRFQNMKKAGVSENEALSQLRQNQAFMDSLKAEKTRLEAGLVSIDPRSGYVKAWVGGRNLEVDWYDHVAIAKRQPGSTFKPFVYTAAIDNGYSPEYMLPDSSFTYQDPDTGEIWQPGNFGEQTGQLLTLREALAMSNNLITARVITQLVTPREVAFYARRMGVRQSELEAVPALGLGTSDVTLLEMASAYATLANGGLYREPTVVTRIQDRFGNVLYEHRPQPEEALSEETAYTVIDMMRGVINERYGTGARMRWQYNLRDYDLAGKTGTTQNAADGWFMLMHPELVTGAWVGFNDRRLAFRSEFWGQGAHNALFLVGDFMQQVVNTPETQLGTERFPLPQRLYGLPTPGPGIETAPAREDTRRDGGRVGW